MLSVYYVFLCTLGVPGMMLTRKIGPKYTLPGYVICWGAMAMLNAGVTNFGGCLAVRACECHIEGRAKCSTRRVRSSISLQPYFLPHYFLHTR